MPVATLFQTQPLPSRLPIWQLYLHLTDGHRCLWNGDFGTVSTSGTTSSVTDFPTVTNPLPAGTPANSGFGTVVTADSNGNFSFTVTDTAGTAETATYDIYSVSNGQINTQLKTGTIGFVPSTTMSLISIAGTQAGSTNDVTSTSAITGTAYGISNVWIEPQNTANDHSTASQRTDASTVIHSDRGCIVG